jgi:cytochrome c oxidase assembly protein subunit 11
MTEQTNNNRHNKVSNQKAVIRLLVLVIGMFGFGFALVPLYDVFCDITGINGKTSDQAASYEIDQVDQSRLVTVQFISRTAQGIPWRFEPQIKQVQVHPGERKVVNFIAKNNASKLIVGQAVPSVSPGQAAVYFQKIECFCFNQQPLEAQEEILMPLQFYIDPELPAEVSTLTLSYTLYDITASADS